MLCPRGNGRKEMDWAYIYTKNIPIESQYLCRKAQDLKKLENYETALRYFRQAVIIAPHYAKACYEMGNCLVKLGQYYEAVVLYNRALAIDPDCTDAQIKRDRIINNGVVNTTEQKKI